MGEVTDCLSAAYDCVLRLMDDDAGVEETPGSQFVEHCRTAEDRRMPWLNVDLGETDRFVYALASVPGYMGKNVSIGLEPGWLAILAQREGDELNGTVCANGAQGAGQRNEGGTGITEAEQTFCVVALPAEVNPLDSIAVLAKGVLGIRMPKACV
jgi:HSP20 family molecular chaperone IbpA